MSRPTDEREHLLNGLTMAFMVLISRQPNMCVKISAEEMTAFDFDHWQLTAFEDSGDEHTKIFALIPDGPNANVN